MKIIVDGRVYIDAACVMMDSVFSMGDLIEFEKAGKLKRVERDPYFYYAEDDLQKLARGA